MSVISLSAMEVHEPASVKVRVPKKIRTGISTVILPQRATWGSVKTMTRVLTSSLAAPQESSSAFRLPNRQPSQLRMSARYSVDEP